MKVKMDDIFAFISIIWFQNCFIIFINHNYYTIFITTFRYQKIDIIRSVLHMIEMIDASHQYIQKELLTRYRHQILETWKPVMGSR